MYKDWNWLIATGGLIAIIGFSLLLGYFIGNGTTCPPTQEGETKSDFLVDEFYCYRVPSPSKCEYIELKNGTLIPKGLCYTTYNYILKCINKSEVKGIVTK
jgi:hypothetical protein